MFCVFNKSNGLIVSKNLVVAFYVFPLCSPHIQFAGYSLEHPVYRHVNLRVQTSPASGVGGEQALAESLELTQKLFGEVGQALDAGMVAWPARKAELEKEAEEKKRRDAERAAKMQRWVAMVQDKSEPWDEDLEVELFGKVISLDLKAAAR